MDVNLNPAMEAKDASVSGRVQTAFTVLVYSFAYTSKIFLLTIVFEQGQDVMRVCTVKALWKVSIAPVLDDEGEQVRHG